ncbi:MAG: AmmeMemoRadiSam system protein B, partial [Chlorobaculum sp.]|nr:AmmeMemoRadiSam system protein B [Chlorobaculum sp.]
PVGYATSISQPHLKVDDLGMGQTAIATLRHWVGYPAIGFR